MSVTTSICCVALCILCYTWVHPNEVKKLSCLPRLLRPGISLGAPKVILVSGSCSYLRLFQTPLHLLHCLNGSQDSGSTVFMITAYYGKRTQIWHLKKEWSPEFGTRGLKQKALQLPEHITSGIHMQQYMYGVLPTFDLTQSPKWRLLLHLHYPNNWRTSRMVELTLWLPPILRTWHDRTQLSVSTPLWHCPDTTWVMSLA